MGSSLEDSASFGYSNVAAAVAGNANNAGLPQDRFDPEIEIYLLGDLEERQ